MTEKMVENNIIECCKLVDISVESSNSLLGELIRIGENLQIVALYKQLNFSKKKVAYPI